METVYVPNVGEVPLQGGTSSKDSQGIYSAPLATGAVTIADGASVTLGAKADAAVTNPALSASEIALLKGLITLLAAGITLAANQSTNTVQLNGNTISTDSGTSGNATQRTIQASAATGTKSSVASSGSSVTILAANTARKGAVVYNDSTQILYLDLSGGTASNTAYSVQIPSNGFFELPGPTIYNGLITGIWASANGNARVTEFS